MKETKRKIETECPRCARTNIIMIPGKFKCIHCDCRFSIDFFERKYIIEQIGNQTKETYKPNKIPTLSRIFYTISSLFLFTYATFGLVHDDIFIPGKRSRGIHFHGLAAEIVYISLILIICNMISIIIDHYDKRDNEINYKKFAALTSFTAWIIFIIALTVNYINLKHR